MYANDKSLSKYEIKFTSLILTQMIESSLIMYNKIALEVLKTIVQLYLYN
jgi:hypothetical protein